MADGVITPAITVTTAIEGLNTFSASAPVIPIVLAIVTFIFILQYFGTKTIGNLFGPVMLTWFLMLGVLGAVALTSCPAILKAFNPVYAVRLLVDYPGWFLVLGAVFLCTAGRAVVSVNVEEHAIECDTEVVLLPDMVFMLVEASADFRESP